MFPRTVLVALAGLLLALGPTSASAASSWTLVDNHQSACFYRPYGTTQYYPVWIKGSWSRPISVSVSGTPAGSDEWTYDSPIDPGSTDGTGSMAYVAVKVPTTTANGQYTAALEATDGSTTQSVPVTLSVQDSCSRY